MNVFTDITPKIIKEVKINYNSQKMTDYLNKRLLKILTLKFDCRIVPEVHVFILELIPGDKDGNRYNDEIRDICILIYMKYIKTDFRLRVRRDYFETEKDYEYWISHKKINPELSCL